MDLDIRLALVDLPVPVVNPAPFRQVDAARLTLVIDRCDEQPGAEHVLQVFVIGIRVMRKGELIYETEVASLRHEKEIVREVRQGFECGISLRNFEDFNIGDILEAYTFEEKKF